MWYKYVLLLALGSLALIGAKGKAKIGPFKTLLVKVAKCEKTTYQTLDKPPMVLHLELYNTSTKYFLLRGNLTVTREVRNVKIQVKNYVWENNRWSPFYVFNNLGCHRMMQLVFSVFSINYDFKTCTFLRGNCTFGDIDMNKIQHSVASTVEYGRLMWRNELMTGKRTTYCWEFEALVVPD